MTSTEAGTGEALRLDQTLGLKPFLGLSLKNGLLNLVTLTLYRFWGKTEVRRRVWSTTLLNGEPFEYTGRGMELFLGFLFALAVFGAPFLLLVFGAQLAPPAVAGLMLLALYGLLPFMIGFGTFIAFRYLASRTAWRGVRFRLEGKAVNYAWNYLVYVFLAGLTLGWFWPAAERRLAEPLWGGLRFGDRPFRFDMAAARKEEVYGAYAIGWFGVGFVYLVGMAGLAAAFAGLGLLTDVEADSPTVEPIAIALAYGLLAFIFLGVVVVFSPYQAAKLRSITAGIRIDGARFKLDVDWPSMAVLSVTNILMVVLSFGFLMPLVQARTARYLVQRVSAEGEADLAGARQAPAGPKTGEGIADAFGFSPI